MCTCERKKHWRDKVGEYCAASDPRVLSEWTFLARVFVCVFVMVFTFASFHLPFVRCQADTFLRIIFPHFSIHLRDYVYLRYYPALRTLEQLERTCLPKAGQYRFCSIMSENIPKLRTQIRDTAMTQLRDFLESIRKHSDKIGETAIKQVHKLILFELHRRELKLVLLACFIFALHLDLLAVCPDCSWLGI